MDVNTVQFPGLGGLSLEISRVAFTVFGIKIYWYGIIIALGFLLAVLLAVRDSRKFDINPDNILDLVLFAAPVAIITARLYYVIFSWDLFRDNPLDIINTRKGGLAIYGAVIGALLTAWIFAARKKIGFLKLTDFCIPFVILAQGIGRWGNFVNQEAFGDMTGLPWRMNGTVPNEWLTGTYGDVDLSKFGVHPAFLYESLWCIAVFFFLMWFRHRKKVVGEVFFLYLILYGFGRFFVEGLRIDSLMVGNGIRVSRILSAALVVVFTALFVYRRILDKKAAEDVPAEPGHSEYGAVLAKLREENDIADQADDMSDAGAGTESSPDKSYEIKEDKVEITENKQEEQSGEQAEEQE